MRSVGRRAAFDQAGSRSRALPTLALAIVVWTGIFALTLAAWSMIDLLR